MSEQPTCQERVADELESRMEDLRQLWEAYCNDPESSVENLGTFDEYGLSFDYVAPQTFKNQTRGYFRYQLSWGGPSDEFRIYAEGQDYRWIVDKIEYWFLDWFDGAKKYLPKADERLMKEIFESYFVQSGSADYAYNEAMKDWEPEEDDEDSEDEED